MGADRPRHISIPSACLVLVLTGLALPAISMATSSRPGSSCAHPVVVTLHRGQKAVGYHHQIIIDAEYRQLIPGVKAIIGWYGWSGPGAEDTDIICSARIQLRDGRWVGPTRLRPYPTPTPVGGEYRETTDPNTQFQQVVVAFAKAPVPRGANCNYPQQSRVGGTMQKGLSAAFRSNTPERGRSEVAVTIHNPNVVICRIVAEEEGQAPPGVGSLFEHIRSFPITIGPHGGLSSPLPQESVTAPTNLVAIKIYTRYLGGSAAVK
jgi:hypothetical protein